MLIENPSVEIKHLDLNFGTFKVLQNLNLQIAQGEFLVLLGSSGCGKSTLLNCIAGLLEPSAGQIFINDKNVTWAEPSDRGIGMVFQSYALYPQMSVEGNLSFGLKNAGLPKQEIKKRVARAAEILQIEQFLHRKPAALSGGQRQRVAIGRALVRDVDVFLFDEPLSNLDAKLRTDLRVELKRLHNTLKNTMIYVTHDQVEAMTLADRIAIMKDGLIQQLDDPKTIYARPKNKYVAGFIGSPAMNFFEGENRDNRFTFDQMALDLAAYDYGPAGRQNGKQWLGIRPEHVVVGDGAKECSFTAEVTIDIVDHMGADTLLWAKFNGKEFRVRTEGLTDIRPNQKIPIGFNADKVSLFDFSTEERI